MENNVDFLCEVSSAYLYQSKWITVIEVWNIIRFFDRWIRRSSIKHTLLQLGWRIIKLADIKWATDYVLGAFSGRGLVYLLFFHKCTEDLVRVHRVLDHYLSVFKGCVKWHQITVKTSFTVNKTIIRRGRNLLRGVWEIEAWLWLVKIKWWLL